MTVPDHKDIASAILSGSLSLAGVLLIFFGAVYARSEQYAHTGGRYFAKLFHKLGLLPFLSALMSSLTSLHWMLTGQDVWFGWCVKLFQVTVIVTGLYGSLATILFFWNY
jgi:hypothetical protein